MPEQKYEKEGGPSLAQCVALLRERSIQPLMDIRQVLHWTVYNYLIGNADAHGKNLSLLLTAKGPMLAPFYDLMSTAVYPELTERMAMKIGGEERPRWIIARRWEFFAEQTGISKKQVRQSLAAFANKLPSEAKALTLALPARYGGSRIIGKMGALIEKRCQKVMRFLG